MRCLPTRLSERCSSREATTHGRLRQVSPLAARVNRPRRTMATKASTWSSSMAMTITDCGPQEYALDSLRHGAIVRANRRWAMMTPGNEFLEQTASMNQNHAHIHREWHRAASGRDIPALIALYAEDAILESPLVPAILSDKRDGMLRGKREIREFLEASARSRPIDLVRWHRSDTYFSTGTTL